MPTVPRIPKTQKTVSFCAHPTDCSFKLVDCNVVDDCDIVADVCTRKGITFVAFDDLGKIVKVPFTPVRTYGDCGKVGICKIPKYQTKKKTLRSKNPFVNPDIPPPPSRRGSCQGSSEYLLFR
jgi:hypothetical protein